MNPRTTGLLALAVLLLGGFIYFYEIRGESARQAARDDEQRIFPGLDSGDVEAIELTTEDGIEVRLERPDGRWRVVSPISARADATALDAVAHALTSLPRAGSVASPAGGAQFGLAEGARSVMFEVAGGSRRLRIGNPTPVGGHVYVSRLVGDDRGEPPEEVSYVESYRLNAFKKSFDDLRERRIFSFDAGEVRTLRVSWPAAGGEVEVALARDESGEWQMGAPATGRADQQTVRELLSDLSFLSARGFVDERSEVVQAALANPAITFYWTRIDDHFERRARLGGHDDGGLIVEGPSGELYTIDPGRMDDFKRTVGDYRFKMLSEFEVTRARRLILDFVDEGEGPMRVEAGLDEAGWTGREPRIDPDRASELVRELASLRAEGIFADEMGPDELASLGLSPPRVKIRVEDRTEPDEKTQVLAEVAIGRFDEDRGLFGQRVGEQSVFVLPLSAVEGIPNSREAFSNDFEARSGDAFEDGEELPPDVLGADPLEGVDIP